MTYINTRGNFLCLDDEGFPVNIKIVGFLRTPTKLFINHNCYPKHKAVMVDLQTKIATLAQ